VLLRVEHADTPTVSDRVLSELIDTTRRQKRLLSALINRRCPNSPTKPYKASDMRRQDLVARMSDVMTCRGPNRPDEQTAKQLLLLLCLPEVQVCLIDDNSRPMLYDLDLRWPHGRVEALEVTRATAASLRHLVHRLRRQGGTVAATECARTWVVPLVDGADVAAVRARIDQLLGLVERAGLTKFGERDERRSVAVARVRRLGVDSAYSYHPKSGQPKIMLELPVRA
jgi:hypothetical protein